MTALLKCCCDPAYVWFLPCALTTGDRLRMSKADFATCGLDYDTVYHYDDGAGTSFCGQWDGKWTDTATATLTSADCADFTTTTGCCACLVAYESGSKCDCYNDCIGYWCDQTPQIVPLDLTGYLGGSGSNDAFEFEVITLSVSDPVFDDCTAGSPVVTFTVTGTILVTFTHISTTYTCDGYSTPQSITLPFKSDITFQCVDPGTPGGGDEYLQGTATAYTTCLYKVPVCADATDDVLDPDPSFTACDYMIAEIDGTSTGTTPVPEFDKFCNVISGQTFSMSFTLGVTLEQGLTTGGCEACDQAGVWHGDMFPDVYASTSVTLLGIWS